MGRKQRIVVIGGNAAGMSAASAAKRVNRESNVLVLEKGDFISYASCSLPYYVSDDIKDLLNLIALTPYEAERERGIKVLLNREAMEIDVKNGIVHARDLKERREETHEFDRLVLALGASPVVPDLPEVDAYGIFTLRTLTDGLRIKEFIKDQAPREAVIIGGGYIGLELSESLAKRGIHVTVVEKMDRVLGNMELEIVNPVEEVLEKHGVRLLKGTAVYGFEKKDGKVKGVITDRESISCDIVILAVGVKPNTEIAKKAGIQLGVSGAISVDENTRTNFQNIYAAGDCAESIHLLTGKKVYIPLGTVANRQGRVAGENAAGKETVFRGVLGTAMTKIFELEVARTGLSSFEAEKERIDFVKVTIKGSSRSRAYPLGKPILITYVVEKPSGTLLGAQMVGEEGVALRIDTVASCIFNRMTVHEISSMDLGYAPPFATVWDPILIAANEAIKKL